MATVSGSTFHTMLLGSFRDPMDSNSAGGETSLEGWRSPEGREMAVTEGGGLIVVCDAEGNSIASLPGSDADR